ncbi:c-type cytochrome [Burkholderia gladioli]|uniref:c-type cytochrome n=1 Tax=Burkholderia gladioli TaxID=28095 RepID=UPI000F81348F|nr:cytochrome c [Burkholderia gladioli]MBU9268139.1 cytochrome c [Burkholderia gladioli]MBU9320617.1 cytochrome c [Burkholderia gladioli]MBU9646517.1 cytochrome c [Burkholderia gladioli]MDN7810361.1 cytochrome c [Burkholderia gladioli]
MNNFVGKQVVAAALVALLATASQAAGAAGNPKDGASKAAMCIGCHGIEDYRTAYPEVYRVPLLGGQNQQYLENALKAYRKKDRHFASMNAIAASLSDQDIADLAAYYASQKPDSKINPYK